MSRSSHLSVAEKMTREDLIDHIHKGKCKMLKGLKLESMTKHDILDHLFKSKCPELKKLMVRD